MKLLIDETFTAWQAFGKVRYGPIDKGKVPSILIARFI